jgi:hypothetical protein
MRLIHNRNRHQQRQKRSLIAITEAEISADLHYPATSTQARRSADARRPQVR